MRTTLTLLVAAAALSGCAGAGAPTVDDALARLNSAGVACKAQDTPLRLARGRTDKSCLTDDGLEIGILGFSDSGTQKEFLKHATANAGGTVFRVLVYDYGYIMFVPTDALGARVTRVMDARSLTTTNTACPTARGGVCPAGATTAQGGS